MELNLKGKVALVTGGARGIGAAICRGLAAEGVRVGVGYRKSADKAAAVVKDIKEKYGEKSSEKCGADAIVLQGDVAQEKDIAPLFDALEEAFGPVDILVNNAAYCPKGPIDSYSREDWDFTFSVNVTGTFMASKEHVRRLRERKAKGKIVNIVSQAAFLGSTSGHLPYDSSKGAMVSMTRAVAREVAAEGINVNAVAPSMVRTEMVAENLKKNEEKYLKRIPLRRIADPEEIANVVTFLASDAASFMTGTTVDVSGGQLMR